MAHEAKRRAAINTFFGLVLEGSTLLQRMNRNEVYPQHILDMAKAMKEKGWTKEDIERYIWSLSDDEFEKLSR